MLMTERKSKEDKYLERLNEVALGRLYLAGFQALMRLHLYFTGRTHEILLEFRDKATSAIVRNSKKDKALESVEGFALQADLMRMWGDTWTNWTAEFQQARREAGRIAFGVQAVSHARLMAPFASELAARDGLSESLVVDGVYEPQLRILMDVAAEYLYGDSLNLSGRIWRIDREARNEISQIILRGVTSQSSAWDVAKELEAYLGAGQDCPRWTSTRLYGRTKSDLAAGDPVGLLSGADCNGRGVAYHALRLARTELQKIHALATDRMMAQQPWVEAEQVQTSPAHGEIDECDAVAGGGENGDGVYLVGTIQLPLHPNCLCYKTAVLMDHEAFTRQMQTWLNGGEWAEMDGYATQLGVPLDSDFTPATINLAVWLFSDDLNGWMA